MNIVIFDLDNTLIPLDSDYEWNIFLKKKKLINKKNIKKNKNWYKKYLKGNLDCYKYLKFVFKILSKFDINFIKNIRNKFINNIIKININKSIIKLINNHKNNGDLILIITATNYFITKPISKVLNLFLIAAKPKINNKKIINKLINYPTYSFFKIINIKKFLFLKNKNFLNFKKSYFYSDSKNDIPLLSIVTNPIITNPNKKFRKYAIKKKWSIIYLF
ncbi:putative HAD-superfamily subfamily IB hydrolase [Candidatus Zinderia insecticola CARI]|uniref:Putative HAD-superfamily subfamily IB hydrolase n=1 Tax=Zinderia insecticola (strain CARI) TaxID=871271 RepID=E0TIW6_ZINIC|nr:putative HAD-superfamily subfamily IB hydrolase [Candidatus Zinderia insecticola CARI]